MQLLCLERRIGKAPKASSAASQRVSETCPAAHFALGARELIRVFAAAAARGRPQARNRAASGAAPRLGYPPKLPVRAGYAFLSPGLATQPRAPRLLRAAQAPEGKSLSIAHRHAVDATPSKRGLSGLNRIAILTSVLAAFAGGSRHRQLQLSAAKPAFTAASSQTRLLCLFLRSDLSCDDTIS